MGSSNSHGSHKKAFDVVLACGARVWGAFARPWTVSGRAGGFSPASRASWAQPCIQYPAGKVDIGQPERNERARGVLGQAAVTHLLKTPQPLDDSEDVLDPGAHPRLHAVDHALKLLGHAALANLLVGPVRCSWRLRMDQVLLRGVCAIAIDPILSAMQQIGQRHGRRPPGAGRPAGSGDAGP